MGVAGGFDLSVASTTAVCSVLAVLTLKGLGGGGAWVAVPAAILGSMVAGTALGAAAVSVLPRPEALGFDLMLPCFAAGMVTGMVHSRIDLLPVAVGAGSALAVFHLAGPAPAIITAGLAAGAVAALLHRGEA